VEFEASLALDPLESSLDKGPDSVAGVFYTSGTTGQPKGVIRTHRTILHRTMLDSVPGEFGPDDTFSLLYSTSFGTSVNDMFSALLNGGVLAVKDVKGSGVGSMVDWLADEPITVLHAPVALMRRLVDVMEPGRQYPRLRMVIPSGRMYRSDVIPLFDHLPDEAVVISRYASTETSLVCRMAIDRSTVLEDGVVPIGQPVGDKHVTIERPNGQLADIGEVGEIVVSSRFMFPGYWDDRTRTAASLTADEGRPGFFRYHTGDHGMLRSDGLYEFVGRQDDRVKIRGYRIETEEVAAAFQALEGVTDVAVRRVEQGGVDHLAAYVVAGGGRTPSTSELRRRILDALPAYMVPSFIIPVAELPLTAGGKVDMEALPPVGTHRPDLASEFVPPRNETEEIICEIWSGVLETSPIGVHDEFLHLGGDSLSAMQVIGRVLGRFGVDLRIRDLMDAGTVALMASAVTGSVNGTGNSPLERRPSDSDIAATYGQTAIWLAEQFGSGGYNMPKVLDLEGPLDTTVLGRSIDIVMERQSALRTTFHFEGDRLTQRVHPPVRNQLEIVESSAPGEADVDALIDEVASRPFDLAVDLPFRARLIRISDQRHVLVLVNHHIAGDRQSSGILLAELAASYRAEGSLAAADLPALPVEYADYALWQEAVVPREEVERQVRFWIERLSARPVSLSPLVSGGPAGVQPATRMTFRCGRSIVDGLTRLARLRGTSRFAAVTAIVASAVREVGAHGQFVVGTTVTRRSRPELESLIGYFANLVAIPIDLSEAQDLDRTIEETGQAVLAALAHSDAPFDEVVAGLRPERQIGRMPLIDLMVNYGRAEPLAFDFGPVRARRMRVDSGRARAPLSVNLRETADEIVCDVVFDPALVTADRAERLMAALERMFETVGEETAMSGDDWAATWSGG
jgi:non-ribosomal peptide synthetase component F